MELSTARHSSLGAPTTGSTQNDSYSKTSFTAWLFARIRNGLALPVLDAMFPALGSAAKTAKRVAPNRMVFVYVPNGIDMRNWRPALSALPLICQNSVAPRARSR